MAVPLTAGRLQVELGFKREKPHVRMPQLSLKYTDKTLLDLANTMDNILFTGPRKPPAGTAAGGKDGAEAGGQQVGPASAASFEIFLDPIIAEYFRALPAMGAVVTMVKEDNQGVPQIFYTQGFGINGRCALPAHPPAHNMPPKLHPGNM